MELADALDIVVARTGHERFRTLARERTEYAALVLKWAQAGPGPVPGPAPEWGRRPLASMRALLARMHACPARRVRTDCGCGGLATCLIGKGHSGLVSHQDCLNCLSGNDQARDREEKAEKVHDVAQGTRNGA